MFIRSIMFAAALFAAVFVYGQDRPLFDGSNLLTALAPSQPMKNVQFVGTSGQIAYRQHEALYVGYPGRAKLLMTVPALNALLATAEVKELSKFPDVDFVSEREFHFAVDGKLFAYNTVCKTLSLLVDCGERQCKDVDIAPLTYYYAYNDADGLYVSCGANTKHFGGDGIVYGQAVHRHEFGIEKGTFWSPKGNLLAFYRMDESMVAEYPCVVTNGRIARHVPFRYPMAGMKSHEVLVGVYNTFSDTVVYLHTRRDTSLAEREAYLTNIAWSPDERYIYLAKLNRDQNHMRMECYDAETGAFVRLLFEECDSRYVEPLEPLHFVPGHPDQFVWASRRNGYNHLYLYNIDGTMLRQLTDGRHEVLSFIGFDKRGNNLFYYANGESLIGRAAYKVQLANGKTTLLTPDKGYHEVAVNSDGKMLIDFYSSLDNPGCAVVSTTAGKQRAQLFSCANPLSGYAVPSIAFGTIKAADDTTDLFYRLILPPNFDSAKRYPVMVYVYGGPHSQMVQDRWLGGASAHMLSLACSDVIVFTVDNRGTSYRGMDFEAATHRRLGTVEVADQMCGYRYLTSLPFVDTARIGVEGWSFGGFMTLSMALMHPEVFKAACAGGPVIDWKWYEVMYGERYMDTPQQNPEGYANASLLNKVDEFYDNHELSPKMLVIHGAVDDVVMWQNSLQFVEHCIDHHLDVDYFVFPRQPHNVHGAQRSYLNKKMYDFFINNL